MERILNQLLEGQKETLKRLDKVETSQTRFETIQKEHGAILQENREILHAVREAQEFQKAELDHLNITAAHIQGAQEETKEIIDNTAGDVSFLVRKAAKTMMIFEN